MSFYKYFGTLLLKGLEGHWSGVTEVTLTYLSLYWNSNSGGGKTALKDVDGEKTTSLLHQGSEI